MPTSPHHPARAAATLVGRRSLLGFGAAAALALAAPDSYAPALGLVAKRTARVSAPPRAFGLITEALPADLTEINTLKTALGRAPTEATYYASWSQSTEFVAADAARIANAGYVPEVVWEPWSPTAGLDQPTYSLAAIAAGNHDTYITRWARQIKTYGRPLVIRFAHEANGNWYPWAVGVNGNTTAQYVAAWRRVVNIFARVGATNVTWSWIQNVPYPGSTPLASLYPGDASVARVGLDGYNFGTTQSWSTWLPFATVFDTGLTEIQKFTTRPLFIAETGSTEIGGDKASWYRDAFAWLADHPEVRGVTWFSINKETDWRINSSQAAFDAFSQGLATFG